MYMDVMFGLLKMLVCYFIFIFSPPPLLKSVLLKAEKVCVAFGRELLLSYLFCENDKLVLASLNVLIAMLQNTGQTLKYRSQFYFLSGL